MQLRPYQIEAINAINETAQKRQLICLPTGTGKTVLFTELVKQRQHLGRSLILVHRDELVRQAKNKCHDAGLDNVGIIEAGQNDVSADVTIASVQTLSRTNRAEQYLDYGPAITLIIDEAHHAPARTYRNVVSWLLDPEGLLVGVTATPDRETQKTYMRRNKRGNTSVGTTLTAGMGAVFDALTYYQPLTDMIAEGWLADLVPATIKTDIDLHSVAKTAGDWQDGALGSAMEKAKTQVDIVSAWQQCATDRPTLAFLPTVATSKAVCKEFTNVGIMAEHIDGTTPFETRQNIYARLRNGTTQVITNCMVLTEGFDEPAVSCIIVARPTNSRGLFAQMIGRGSRLHPNKTDCLVLSVVDHSLDLDPVTLQTFLDDKGWKDGQKLSERKTEVAEEPIPEIFDGPDVTAEAIQFVQAFKRKANAGLVWHKSGSAWRLYAGKDKGWVILVPVPNGDIEHWQPKLANGDLITNCPLPLDGAVAESEQWVRHNGTAIISDPNAKWRADEPTEAQISLAKKFKIDTTNLTKGELSDKISDKQTEPASNKQISYARRLGHPNPELATKSELSKWIGANAPRWNNLLKW